MSLLTPTPRVSSGDAAFMHLLPWLIDCYSSAMKSLTSASAHQGRSARVVTTMLSSLQGCMTDACNASDATLWSTAAAASAELVRAAHRCELLGGSVDVQEALASHIAVAVKQLEQLDRMLSAASACNQMFVALADVDVRVLEPHLQGMWHALWASHRHDVAGAGRAACDVISAYGDIRQVPALLRAFTEALTSAQAAQQGGQIAAMSCAAAISAAWCAAATKVPAAQTPSVLVVVQECLNVAQEAGVLGGRQASTATMLPCLADALASVIAGLPVTPAATTAVGEAAAVLQEQVNQLHAVFGDRIECRGSVACVLRISIAICSLAHSCCDNAGDADEARGASACITACGDLFTSTTSRFLADVMTNNTPWLHYELARAAVLQATWAGRAADEGLLGVSITQVEKVMPIEVLQSANFQHVWDGTLPSLDTTAAAVAIWQLLTETTSSWCVSICDCCVV